MQRNFDSLSASRSEFLLLFGLVVFSAIILPMLPLWQGAMRLLACAVLVASLAGSAWRKPVVILMLLMLGYAVFAWFDALVQTPARHVIHALTDVYGQPLGLSADGAILLVDIVCVFGLGYVLLARARNDDRLVNVFVGCLLFFWAWSLAGSLVRLSGDTDAGMFAQILTGTSVWATWIYFSFLAILLLRDENEVRDIIGWISKGALVVAVVVALQWLLSDFSYVLDAPRFEDYFYRVRGTYYYHTSATFALILCGLLIFSLAPGKSWREYSLLALVIFIVALAMINNSRALSLALSVGIIVIAAGAYRRRQSKILLLSLVGALLVVSNAFYIKPEIGPRQSYDDVGQAQPPANSIAESETREKTSDKKQQGVRLNNDVDKWLTSNEDRASLLYSSLDLVGTSLWFGQGVGVLQIPLIGNSFNGLQNTYSSHTLYLDMLLMAGLPALLALVAAFSLAAWRSATGALIKPDLEYSYRAAPLLAALAIFAVAGFFIPQERNELIGVGFLLAALALIRPGFSPEASMPDFLRTKKACIGLLVLAVGVWAFLTSPSYVFPVIELVARHGSEIRQNNSAVVVTEPGMEPVAKVLLRIWGIDNPDVSVLRDSVDNLPEDNTWLLWSPKTDAAYPRLREELGYQEYRQGGHAPSVRLPPEWWIMPSSQPLVIFAYAGPRRAITVPVSEVVSITSYDEREGVPAVADSEPDRFVASGGTMQWTYTSRNEVPGKFEVAVISHPDGADLGKAELIHSTVKPPAKGRIVFDSGAVEPGAAISLHATIKTLPNIANEADVTVTGNYIGLELFIADYDYGTATFWPTAEPVSVLFKLRERIRSPIGVYRMFVFNYRGRAYTGPYSWTVEASENGIDWITVDRRTEVRLSRDPEHPSAFLLSKRGLFQYYRFRFEPPGMEGEGFSGLAEIELFAIPGQ